MSQHQITNAAHKTNWRLDIPTKTGEKSFVLSSQEASLPGVNVAVAHVSLNPMMQTSVSGSGVTFDPLHVRILIDEQLDSYLEIYEWMLSTVDYIDNECSEPEDLPPFITINILDNMKRDVVCSFRYYEAFPYSVGPLDFSYLEEGNMAMVCEVSFQYKYFEVEVGGRIIKPKFANSEKAKNEIISLHPALR